MVGSLMFSLCYTHSVIALCCWCYIDSDVGNVVYVCLLVFVTHTRNMHTVLCLDQFVLRIHWVMPCNT
jgi:hypothetical protein